MRKILSNTSGIMDTIFNWYQQWTAAFNKPNWYLQLIGHLHLIGNLHLITADSRNSSSHNCFCLFTRVNLIGKQNNATINKIEFTFLKQWYKCLGILLATLESRGFEELHSKITMTCNMVSYPSQHAQVGPTWAQGGQPGGPHVGSPCGTQLDLSAVSTWDPHGLPT